MLAALCAATASSGYLLYEGIRFKKYLDFKKYGEFGKGENHLRLFTGTLRRIEDTAVLKSNFLISTEGSILSDVEDRILREVKVEEGFKKTGTYYTYQKIGKSTIMIPHTYTYTDYNTIHSRVHFSNKFKIGKVPVVMNSIDNVNYQLATTSTKMYPCHAENAFQLLKLGQPNYEANKYRFTEGHISYGDKVTIAGKYKRRKELIPRFIGTKNQVLGMVRKQIFRVNGFGIACAVVGLVGSGIFLKEEYDKQK